MFTDYGNDSYSCSAYIKAIDLIRIADQMLRDGMEFAKINVFFDDRLDCGSVVRISAIPSLESNNIKVYPDIEENTLVGEWIDDEER